MRKISDEKKCVILLALTIFMGFVLFYTYIGDIENDHEGIIRLHVIANSNDAEDQALKLKVRDGIIAYMDQQDDLTTTEETREYLRSDLDRLETIANGIIASEGYDYTAKAKLGIRYIPEKTYGDITFPAGNYEALNITLGEGEGENWWCVLFPPLCLLDEGTITADEIEGLDSDEVQSLAGEDLSDLDSDEMTADQKLQLQLRWKVLTILNQED